MVSMTCRHTGLGSRIVGEGSGRSSSSGLMELVKVEELGVGEEVEVVGEVEVLLLHFLARRDLVEVGQVL